MINHLIRSLSTTKDFHLIAQFDDGSIKSYDVEKLSKRNSVFKELITKPTLFTKAKVDTGGYGVIWNDALDLSANEIWANGEAVNNSFSGLLAFSDASRIWNLNESTLRKALVYGKLKAGTDCCKYGKQWIITEEAMVREYGVPRSLLINQIDKDEILSALAVAEDDIRNGNVSDAFDSLKEIRKKYKI